MKMIKLAVRLFLAGTMVLAGAGWLPADEVSAVKDGHYAYWSNINDGRGSCTTIREHFTADNQEVPQHTVKKDYEWTFAGSRVRYSWKMQYFPGGDREGASSANGGLPAITYEVYVDEERVTAGDSRGDFRRKGPDTRTVYRSGFQAIYR